jgi:hypothetical protein
MSDGDFLEDIGHEARERGRVLYEIGIAKSSPVRKEGGLVRFAIGLVMQNGLRPGNETVPPEDLTCALGAIEEKQVGRPETHNGRLDVGLRRFLGRERGRSGERW